MTYTYKLSRRLATLPYSVVPLALLVALLGCSDGSMTGESDLSEPMFALASSSSPPVIEPESAIAQTNQAVQFTIRSRSGGDLATATVEWIVSGGTITQTGLFTAATPGTYKVTVRSGKRQKSDSAIVTVVPVPVGLSSIVATPDSVTIPTGTPYTFAAQGRLGDSSVAAVGVEWTGTGGTIDAGGVYKAGSVPGRYRVVARSVDGNLADTSSVIIPEPASPLPPAVTLVSVELTPATVSLQTGAQQQFTASGRWSDSTTSPVTVAFSAAGGSVTASGLYTAGGVPGGYRVIARDSASSLADTSVVTIAGSTSTCVPSATALCPGDDLQAKVSAAPVGTAFSLAPGVYRLQSVTPKAGNSFTGPRSAILSGAILVTGWTRTSGGWTAPVSYSPGPLSGTCNSGTACQNPNDVYRDDVLLRSGYTLTATTLTVTEDPTGHRLELAVLPRAFTGAASGVRLSGFTVEKYAAPYNAAAINAPSSPNWVIDGIEGRWNHGAAVFAGPGNRVTNGYFHHNGQYGLLGNAANMVIQGNEIAYNNTAGFSQSWAAGGTKFAFTTGLLVSENFVHHNYGHAIWVDIANYQAVIERNRVEDNYGRGVFYEISYDAVIRNNRFARNGSKASVLLRGGCIGVVSSPNVEVYGNTCDGDKDGITGVQDARGSGPRGVYELTNLYVHDNTLTNITAYAAGIVQTVNDLTYYTSRNNRWVNNTYNGGTATPFYWQNAARTPAQWAGYGQR